MKYGGEKRVRYLRRRHLRRLGGELEVKPALVERRAVAMIERVLSSSDDARHSLPVDFQDRPLLDRITEVIVERSSRLQNALSEPPDARPPQTRAKPV